MHQFAPEGPLDIPFAQGKASKSISAEQAREFWEHHPHLTDRRGCYIFAIRAGRGIIPAYVGKATKTFKQEVFAPDKLAKYQRVLSDYRKGTPVFFFLVSQQERGKPNTSIVGELEDFLIQTALIANDDLINVRGTKRADFSISGVLRGGKGKPSGAAKALKRCLRL